MKTCIFYGNCQVIYNVYDVLNSIPEFRDQYKSIRYVNHDRDQTRELSNINIDDLKNCDLFIYQPLGINHGVFSTDNIKKLLKDECVKISFPYVYNSSFYTTYWEGASSRWTIGTLVNCGWKNIMKLILEEYKIDEILSLYDEDKIDFYFEERMNICMRSLREKEKDCDIKVTDFILNNFKDKRLFITQNHLTDYFNKWISNRILEILNMSLLPDEYSNDVLVEANCVYDSYNKKYYDFSYDIKSITDNNSTRYKIVEFYNFFKNRGNNFKVEDIVPYIIINDPENFINSPYA